MTAAMRYNLEQFNKISFNGFEFTIPPDTVELINSLTQKVGSPLYIKTPVFQKRENKEELNVFNASQNSGYLKLTNKKRKGNREMEMNEDEWDTLRTFQETKIETKTGVDALIDQIRLNLNKLTDKTFLDMREKIISVIELLVNSEESLKEEDKNKLAISIYEIASNNKFYSKIYADLYAELIVNYTWLRPILDNSYSIYIEQFKNIQFVEANHNYDKFCDLNKINEKRKSNTQFFLNLANNNILTLKSIGKLLKELLQMVADMIEQPDKKNEVDEITENVFILYKKDLLDKLEKENDYNSEEYKVNSNTFSEFISKLAKSKAKDYKSLSNKAIFKYMDLIEI